MGFYKKIWLEFVVRIQFVMTKSIKLDPDSNEPLEIYQKKDEFNQKSLKSDKFNQNGQKRSTFWWILTILDWLINILIKNYSGQINLDFNWNLILLEIGWI